MVGNIAYVAGTFTSIRQPNNGATIAQPCLAAYNWSTGQVLTTFRPTFTSGTRDGGRGLAGRHQALRLR